MPFIIGIKQSKTTIPIKPIIIPAIILSHNILKHIPMPRAKVPDIASKITRIILGDILTGVLFYIFLHIIMVIQNNTMPKTPNTTPCLKACHCGIGAIHIPRAKSIPLTVPNIIAVKLLFFT